MFEHTPYITGGAGAARDLHTYVCRGGHARILQLLQRNLLYECYQEYHGEYLLPFTYFHNATVVL